jgi:hypothetical protein
MRRVDPAGGEQPRGVVAQRADERVGAPDPGDGRGLAIGGRALRPQAHPPQARAALCRAHGSAERESNLARAPLAREPGALKGQFSTSSILSLVVLFSAVARFGVPLFVLHKVLVKKVDMIVEHVDFP